MSSDTPENALPLPPLPPGAPPVDDALPGMKLGDYVVEKAVAWGGMGIVYRARHPLLGRSVAVKVLRPNFAFDPEQAARFLKEAQAISAIKHRGIIDIISFGDLPDGRNYMVMEFLEGETLEEVMKREGAMAPAHALGIVDEILDALSAAHKVGVVHRDLKPSNVFITMQSNGARYVKLVDFGLARRAPLTDLKRIDDKASLMAGTPEYLSPEQVKGLAATPRTDLYSLGVMLFEMVTGQLPFKAGSLLELLNAHRIETAPRASTLVSSLPAMLDDLIANCMQKEPAQRPSSADSARGTVQRMLRQLKDDQTHVVASPLRLHETEKTVRMQPRPDTDRIPVVAASMFETVKAAPPQAKTDPRRPKPAVPIGVWAGMAACAVALAIAVFVVKADRTVVEEVALPPEPPQAVEATAEPVVPPAPVAVEDIEPEPLPAPKPVAKKDPPPKKDRAPPPPPPTKHLACEEATFKDNLADAAGQIEQAWTKQLAGTKPNPAHRAELDALIRRIRPATAADCTPIMNGLAAWRQKHLGAK